MPNNPLYNLTAQKISFTYQNLLQTDGYGNYYNGLGDEIFVGGGTGSVGPTGPIGPTGSQGIQGVTGPSIVLIRESDYVYPYHYSGTSLFGTLTSSPTWEIKRIDFSTPGSPLTQSATGSWDNRTSLIYS
jgi:hypothetical protein